eukprot:6192010-Pleurochrysis_carterae.AAC.6
MLPPASTASTGMSPTNNTNCGIGVDVPSAAAVNIKNYALTTASARVAAGNTTLMACQRSTHRRRRIPPDTGHKARG